MENSNTAFLRLDLFLKRSRLLKRRSLAATLCENGYVTLNGRLAQPGKRVHDGDRIGIRYPKKQILVQVTGIPETSRNDPNCYLILREERIEDEPF